MKNSKIWLAACLFAFISIQLFAQEEPDKRNVWTGGQKGYVVTGDLTVLKGQKTFNIIMDPHIMKMGAKEEPDTIYINKRVLELNDKKAGEGDKWLAEWNESKKNFKAAFIEGFNARVSSKGVNVGLNDSDAEYTFIIYSKTLMEFWGDMYLILDMDVVKTANPDIKIVSIRFPLNNSGLKSKQFKGKNERAYYGAGNLFGKYCSKKVF